MRSCPGLVADHRFSGYAIFIFQIRSQCQSDRIDAIADFGALLLKIIARGYSLDRFLSFKRGIR